MEIAKVARIARIAGIAKIVCYSVVFSALVVGPTVNTCHSERSEESAFEEGVEILCLHFGKQIHRIYIGMTNSLFSRVMQHKSGEVDGFTKKYQIHRLVYYEVFQYVNNCIAREKQLKGWSRDKKVALIVSSNPTWEDLAEDWGTEIEPLLQK